jgi:glutamate/tyrosine decarboxylase-like PLP-dependent enzyme
MASTEQDLNTRDVPVEMSAEEFREVGHRLVDEVAGLLESIRERPVTPGETAAEVRDALGWTRKLPERGESASTLVSQATRLMFEHSLFVGSPRFLGYVVGAPSPIGALADMLAAAVNPNVGGWPLSPMASEIEGQTIRWIAEWLGYPTDCGGLLVSGGNMANFVGFLAARHAKSTWDVRAKGAAPSDSARLRCYTSGETHTWVQKAADLFGLGTDAITWVPTDAGQRMDVTALAEAVAADRRDGALPFLVVASAGTVSTGAIDPLRDMAELSRTENLWLHVDGAYGGIAAGLPDAPEDLKALALADSVAVDPHKWLYAPAEAGCALVRDREVLHDTFRYTPPYYHLDRSPDAPLNYYEWGPQNSRGFRALKVWLNLRQAGRDGYRRMVADDIALARRLFELVDAEPELEAVTHSLSITTFRYVPESIDPQAEGAEDYLDTLNTALLERIEKGGEVFVSNAIVDGRFLLRACIVNFRTTAADIDAIPAIVRRVGAELHAELRPPAA